MSFKCNLYKTLSERSALTKIFESGTINLEGTLLNNTSIINPSIRIHRAADDISQYNYMYIPDFHRKYFINDITALNADTCIVQAHVDVLGTYENFIRPLDAVIARQENKYNLYLDDNLFKIDSRTIIQTVQFDKGGYFTQTPGIALVVVG